MSTRDSVDDLSGLIESRLTFQPLALLVWGCRFTMSYVNPHLVTAFIREHALRGPEKIPRDGDYDEGLLNRAQTVSDLDDTRLCPNFRV